MRSHASNLNGATESAVGRGCRITPSRSFSYGTACKNRITVPFQTANLPQSIASRCLCVIGPDKLNGRPMAGCGGQPGVTGDQRGRKRLCESQISSIIGGGIVTKCPNA